MVRPERAGEGTAKALSEQENQENLKLSLRVEEERKARLELERALAPETALAFRASQFVERPSGRPAFAYHLIRGTELSRAAGVFKYRRGRIPADSSRELRQPMFA
jgi:hypothetical protein